jgi:iron-sulfur cluster repair protein YtfE (RIC family)
MPNATDEHRRQGRKLAAIHRGHLWEIARIARVIERIEAGDAPPEALRDIVLASDMAQNFRAFGSLCGRECKMLQFHHDAEEHHMFPELERKGTDAIRRLVARLREEHEIVHELLARLERASMALMFEPSESEFADAKAIFSRLVEVVRSHFGYEESELEEAIGLFLDAI